MLSRLPNKARRLFARDAARQKAADPSRTPPPDGLTPPACAPSASPVLSRARRCATATRAAFVGRGWWGLLGGAALLVVLAFFLMGAAAEAHAGGRYLSEYGAGSSRPIQDNYGHTGRSYGDYTFYNVSARPAFISGCVGCINGTAHRKAREKAAPPPPPERVRGFTRLYHGSSNLTARRYSPYGTVWVSRR